MRSLNLSTDLTTMKLFDFISHTATSVAKTGVLLE